MTIINNITQKPNSLRIINHTGERFYYYFSNIEKESEDYENRKRQLYITKKLDSEEYSDICNPAITSDDGDILDITDILF